MGDGEIMNTPLIPEYTMTEGELFSAVQRLAREFHKSHTRAVVQQSPVLIRSVEILRRALDPRPDRVGHNDRALVAREKETS